MYLAIGLAVVVYAGFAIMVGRFCSLNSRWERAIVRFFEEQEGGAVSAGAGLVPAGAAARPTVTPALPRAEEKVPAAPPAAPASAEEAEHVEVEV
jgi:hypothetical protein